MSSVIGGLLGAAGGGSIGKAVVDLQLETSKYNSQLATAEGETKAKTSSMSSATSKMGAATIAVYAAVAVGVFEFAKTSIEAAIQVNEANDKMANSVENSATVSKQAIPVFQAQAAAVSDLTGTYAESITGLQSFLVQMHLTQDQVTTLTPLVVDLATKQGIDLTTAAKAVGKAVNGTVGGLSRMGVVVDKTAAKTDAYGATLKALGVVQGFAAERAKAEPWKLLGNEVHKLTVEIGQDLVPALVGIIPTLDEIVKHAKPAFDLLGNIIKETTSAGIQNPTVGGGTSPLDAMFGVGFTAAAIGGKALLDDYTSRLTVLIETYKMGGMTAADFNASVGELLTQVGQSPDVFGTATDFTVLYEERIKDTKLATDRFTTSTNEAAIATKNFKNHLHTAGASLLSLDSTIKSTFDLTPAQLKKDFDQMLAVTLRWRADEEKALKMKPGSFGISPSDFTQFFNILEAKGPDAVDAFVRANHKAQQQMITDWERAAHAIGAAIKGAFPGSINVPVTAVLHHRVTGP